MKALTLHQPWATLIAIGAKQYETRSWETIYRGPVVIHAAKRRPEYLWSPVKELLADAGYFALEALPFGAGLCVAELINTYLTDEVKPSLPLDEIELGNFAAGRFAWCFVDVRRFDEPIPCRGMQGLWDWTLPL